MTSVIVDCTELYRNPVRTGIQRVVRKLLRHWPDRGPELHLAYFDGSSLVRLPERARRLLADETPGARDMSYRDLVQQLANVSGDTVDSLPETAAALIPEVFYDRSRANFHVHRVRDGRLPLAMLAYDFLPFLQPQLFNLRSAAPLMGYLVAIREASSVAHISAQTAGEAAVEAGPLRVRGPRFDRRSQESASDRRRIREVVARRAPDAAGSHRTGLR